MKSILITHGPYRGQTLQLEDDVAKVAIKDKWGLDPSVKDFDPYGVQMGAAAGDLPESLQKFLAGGEEAPAEDTKADTKAPSKSPAPEAETEVKSTLLETEDLPSPETKPAPSATTTTTTRRK